MSGKEFLLQGLTADTHRSALRSLFAMDGLERGLLSVAFVTESGVALIASELAAAGARVDAYVGIRNDITSREGLVALLDAGVNVHYVDTGAKNLLFHPKIYLCRSKTRARAIVGSANLTLGGLNNNIESSVVLDLDVGLEDDYRFVQSVIGKFEGLTAVHPKHVVRIESASDVDELLAEGRLVDEASSASPQGTSPSGPKGADELSPIGLKVQRLGTRVKKRATGKGERSTGTVSSEETGGESPGVGVAWELVWRSKELTERDLGVPSGRTTHPTGSINLDKGLLEEEVDHRHYFRDEVFAALAWEPRAQETEEAHARFRLIVKGVHRGEFEAAVRHSTSTTRATYLQRNAMTRLSWGAMKEFVAREDLLGRTMSLYRDKSDQARFVVEID